ncbi:MAG: hypothetical protein NPIRA05_13020 [Nitrospirales bacterium]|nr:MAG: hypothetical protein NPIRA05_13020 [Nitrospirales bacterium]
MKTKIVAAIVLILALTIVSGTLEVISAHRIIKVEGRVELKKIGESEYRVAGVGARLQYGDLLRPERSAIVKVFCDNQQVWRVPAGVVSGLAIGCPEDGSDIFRSTTVEVTNREGGNDPHIPYILSPRMTCVLDERPTLRWNALEGASRYTLRLVDEVDVMWQANVTSTEIIYPNDAPKLERGGVRYLLIVNADNVLSSLADGGNNFGFELLEEHEVAAVKKAERKIAELLDLTHEERVIALAAFFSDTCLMNKAIETLEVLVKEGSQSYHVYRMLGDLYAKVGLNLLAKTRYSTALKISRAIQDQYGLKEIEMALARVKTKLEEQQPLPGIFTGSIPENIAVPTSE